MGVIKKTVSKMLTILPFEKTLYDKAGVPCEFVGHPLLDHLPKNLNREIIRKNLGIKPEDLAVGLLAGSRKKEVLRIFPLMLESAVEIQKRCPKAVFFTRPSANVPKTVYEKLLAKHPTLKVRILESNLHELMVGLDFALIASGTATLETALLGTPYFLLYKASRSTYFLGKYLVKVAYLGLVNLLANKRVVPEFIQNDIRPSVIADEVKRYLDHPELICEMKEDFKRVRAMLGEEGASARAARSVLSYLKTSSQTH